MLEYQCTCTVNIASQMKYPDIYKALKSLEFSLQHDLSPLEVQEAISDINVSLPKDAPKELMGLWHNISGLVEGVKRNYAQAIIHFSKVNEIAQSLNSKHLKVRALSGLTTSYFNLYQNEKALTYAIDTIEMSSSSDYYFTAIAKDMIGRIKSRFGYDIEALALFLEARDMLKGRGHLIVEGRILSKLSELYLTNMDVIKAEKFAVEALNLYESSKSEREKMSAKIRLCTILSEKGDNIKAISILESLLVEYPDKKQPDYGTILTLLGNHYSKSSAKKAVSLYTSALKIFATHGLKQLRSNTLANMAKYLYVSNAKKAIQTARNAYENAAEVKHKYMMLESLLLLYSLEKKQGNVKKALKYHEEYYALKNLADTDVLKLKLDFITVEKDAKIKQMQYDSEVKRSTLLQLELEHKERELTEKTRHLIKQTEAVAQFRDDLRALIRRTPSDDPIVKSIKERLSNEPDKQLSWLEFEEEFKKVHPDYVVKLNVAYPTLTKMEQKICMMLRIGLTSVDIAKLLFLSERNIENHRYRIRKKLSLNSEVSLHEFLAKV